MHVVGIKANNFGTGNQDECNIYKKNRMINPIFFVLSQIFFILDSSMLVSILEIVKGMAIMFQFLVIKEIAVYKNILISGVMDCHEQLLQISFG